MGAGIPFRGIRGTGSRVLTAGEEITASAGRVTAPQTEAPPVPDKGKRNVRRIGRQRNHFILQPKENTGVYEIPVERKHRSVRADGLCKTHTGRKLNIYNRADYKIYK